MCTHVGEFDKLYTKTPIIIKKNKNKNKLARRLYNNNDNIRQHSLLLTSELIVCSHRNGLLNRYIK